MSFVPSSGIEMVNSAALLLLFLLNLLLVGRQERLNKTEMVRRLRRIIAQLNGELGYDKKMPRFSHKGQRWNMCDCFIVITTEQLVYYYYYFSGLF